MKKQYTITTSDISVNVSLYTFLELFYFLRSGHAEL